MPAVYREREVAGAFGFRRLLSLGRPLITGTRFHDLRHAYARTLLAANVHPKVVSDVLGHSSAAFTMDTYQHLLPSMGHTAAAAIEATLGEHLG
jgi:integrase